MPKVAERAAALANLAAPGQRNGTPYRPPAPEEVLVRFCPLLSPESAALVVDAPGAAGRLSSLGGELYQVLAAPGIDAAAVRLNALIARCHAQPYLVKDVGQPYHLHFHGAGQNFVDALGGELATGLALLIDTLGEDRFGRCQAHGCDRVYVDLTRSGTRRFCDQPCAARARVLAYRTRRAAE
jgi:hypothetical protein